MANETVLIGGGDLPEDYHLAQFHFHWGADNSKGSEHFLNGRQFPMEVHSTHNNSATYRASLNAHTTTLAQITECKISTSSSCSCDYHPEAPMCPDVAPQRDRAGCYLQVHFVHYADSRTELGQAADKPNGLAVLGFFFEVSSLPAHCC